ncbi:MAG: response regulator [Candidatus Omnitrophica bacterium]|nr:response regulator [Candidatus Omnitrophota bacterium]
MPKKILLVDDDPSVHLLATPVLIKAGHSVISAKNGEQGLQMALNERPDLIILDVIMPGIKGRDLCAKIKSYEVLKKTPVMFLTAKESDEDIRTELDAGAVTHLTKPIDSVQLASIVKGIFR